MDLSKQGLGGGESERIDSRQYCLSKSGEQGSKGHLTRGTGGCGGGEEIGLGKEPGVPILEETPGLQVNPEKGSLENWVDARGGGESVHLLPGFGDGPEVWAEWSLYPFLGARGRSSVKKGLNPFPVGSGDPERKGKSLWHFPGGEGGRAESSIRKEEVVWEGEGEERGGGKGKGGKGSGRSRGGQGEDNPELGTRSGNVIGRMRAVVMT